MSDIHSDYKDDSPPSVVNEMDDSDNYDSDSDNDDGVCIIINADEINEPLPICPIIGSVAYFNNIPKSVDESTQHSISFFYAKPSIKSLIWINTSNTVGANVTPNREVGKTNIDLNVLQNTTRWVSSSSTESVIRKESRLWKTFLDLFSVTPAWSIMSGIHKLARPPIIRFNQSTYANSSYTFYILSCGTVRTRIETTAVVELALLKFKMINFVNVTCLDYATTRIAYRDNNVVQGTDSFLTLLSRVKSNEPVFHYGITPGFLESKLFYWSYELNKKRDNLTDLKIRKQIVDYNHDAIINQDCLKRKLIEESNFPDDENCKILSNVPKPVDLIHGLRNCAVCQGVKLFNCSFRKNTFTSASIPRNLNQIERSIKEAHVDRIKRLKRVVETGDDKWYVNFESEFIDDLLTWSPSGSIYKD